MEDTIEDLPDIELQSSTPIEFIPPSIHRSTLFSGASYTHFSLVPPSLLPPTCSSPTTPSTPQPLGPPCCLGVDEAGRGPVLGPMVYGCFYLPISLSTSLLSSTHHFDDSKVLTPSFRAELMEKLCTPPSPASDPSSPNPTSLYDNCGWAVDLLSARSISAGMLRPAAAYNLNAQAMDSTIGLIQSVYALGVNVKEIYIDTIGQPAAYQKKLERIFPTANITVAKKADSLYPCVSAASVAAKVTRDVALEVLYSAYNGPSPSVSRSAREGKRHGETGDEEEGQDVEMDEAPAEAEAEAEEPSWGSGYPSDARCTTWLKRNIDPVFGWGTECRFSWGTAKDLLDNKSLAAQVAWPVENDDADNARLTDFFAAEGDEKGEEGELGAWFGGRVGVEAF